MFFDNIDGDHHVFLCHDCAHNLCDATPWLARLIQPEGCLHMSLLNRSVALEEP